MKKSRFLHQHIKPWEENPRLSLFTLKTPAISEAGKIWSLVIIVYVHLKQLLITFLLSIQSKIFVKSVSVESKTLHDDSARNLVNYSNC